MTRARPAPSPGAVDWQGGWWHLKLLSVVLMTAFHMHLARARKGFLADGRPGTERYWRAMNEVPTPTVDSTSIMPL